MNKTQHPYLDLSQLELRSFFNREIQVLIVPKLMGLTRDEERVSVNSLVELAKQKGMLTGEFYGRSKHGYLYPLNDQCVSASHNDDYVCLAISSKKYQSVGVDIESYITERQNQQLQSLVLSSPSNLLNDQYSSHLNTTVNFSVKESTYKCYYPAFHQFLDFKDISLTYTEPAEHRFNAKIELTTDKQLIEGQYLLHKNYVLSVSKMCA